MHVVENWTNDLQKAERPETLARCTASEAVGGGADLGWLPAWRFGPWVRTIHIAPAPWRRVAPLCSLRERSDDRLRLSLRCDTFQGGVEQEIARLANFVIRVAQISGPGHRALLARNRSDATRSAVGRAIALFAEVALHAPVPAIRGKRADASADSFAVGGNQRNVLST
jgi:hypothetical protein